MRAQLLLEDGTCFEGETFGAQGTVIGELVFNTGMTGYQEILTDPSYAGQIVIMTYPLIGNYGINEDDVESGRIQVTGFVVKERAPRGSHWQKTTELHDYLYDQKIPGISGVDTRMLTKKIRNQGAMGCVLTTEPITDKIRDLLKNYRFPKDIVSSVSRKTAQEYPGKGPRLAVVDFGLKEGILRILLGFGCAVKVFPWNATDAEILAWKPAAVLFSNGPGDPADVTEGIATIKALVGKLPLFGICLGHQLLSLALGAKTYKLLFGHRGSNHPVQDLVTGRVYMTAQNHGFAVQDDSIPAGMKITHRNVNDGTIEGFEMPEARIASVQFHPEEGPGPEDARVIVEEWIKRIS